jgi:flagellar motor switch protein FliN
MTSPATGKSQTLKRLLRIEVPLIAVMGEKRMKLGEVLALKPGTVLELGKPADEPLELMVNDRRVGHGRAVRVGEAYGLEITEIGSPRDTIRNLG